MRRNLSILLLLVVLGAVGFWAVTALRRLPASVVASPVMDQAVTVSDMVVVPVSWQPHLKAFGQTRAVQGAELSSPVAGIVGEIDFRSGQTVPAGTVLLRLRAYDDPARLAQAQAQVALWTANLARDQKQFAVQAISRATLDLDIANLHNFEAQAEAQLQAMDEKVVRAPFAGQLGIRQVDLGQYLPPGTAVTTLQALDPIYVDFNVAERYLAECAPGRVVSLAVASAPGHAFQARIEAADSRVDPQSRMVMVRAGLANPDHALLPGMFAVVQLGLEQPRPVLLIPQSAISYNPYGDVVYVLRPDGQASGQAAGRLVAHAAIVTTLDATDGRVVVESGLRPGDTIVIAGQLKLRDGSVVRVDNSVLPPAPSSADPVDE